MFDDTKQSVLVKERRLRNCLKTINPKLDSILEKPFINKTDLAIRMYPDLAKIKTTRATALFFHKITGERKFTDIEQKTLEKIIKEYINNQIELFTSVKTML
jgi:hypothetical protein